MAFSFLRGCGRILFLILLGIQNFHLFSTYFSLNIKQYEGTIGVVVHGMALSVIETHLHYESMIIDVQKGHLANFFRRWQFYTCIILVPSIIVTFGLDVVLVGKERYYLPDIDVYLCITPILLILLLTTADDSFSSKSHKELVQKLSVPMVADLFDAIEMLDNAFESSSKAFDLSLIFLVIGAIITVIVSSLQMAEYKFIDAEGFERESKEQIRYKPNVFRKIAELVINVVVLTIRLKVLIEHGKIRSTIIIFKNFIFIFLSVIHICTLRPRVQPLVDV